MLLTLEFGILNCIRKDLSISRLQTQNRTCPRVIIWLMKYEHLNKRMRSKMRWIFFYSKQMHFLMLSFLDGWCIISPLGLMNVAVSIDDNYASIHIVTSQRKKSTHSNTFLKICYKSKNGKRQMFRTLGTKTSRDKKFLDQHCNKWNSTWCHTLGRH